MTTTSRTGLTVTRLLAVALAIAAMGSLATAAPPAGSQPGELPVNKWVAMNEPPMGVQVLGWDEIRYAPELDGVLFYGAFRSFTSENQNAIWLYRFRENRWRLLHVNPFFVRDELACDGGHTSGRMVFDRARKVLVHQGLVSMSRNDRFRTWVFDPLALVGWDANPTPPTANIEYDGASCWLDDMKVSFMYRADRGAWAYDAAANKWQQLAPPGKGPGLTTETVYDAKRKRVLAFGASGGHYGGKPWKTFNALWAFDLEAKAWTKLEAKNPPPTRGWSQVAISTAADVMLLTGGLTGEMNAQGVVKSPGDTWVLDLETLEWRDLETPMPLAMAYANHLAYDAANDVFLFAGHPTKNLGYGYGCGMWAFKYQGKNPTKAVPPVVAPLPAYDFKSLPKADGEWAAVGSGPMNAVKGWAFRPAMASNGGELLLAFGEYDPPGKYQHEGCYVYAFKFANGKWDKLGGAAASDVDAHAQCPAVAFDSAGKPVVAYQSLRLWKPIELIVKRFDGKWAQIGAVPPPENLFKAHPSLAGGAGDIALAWQHHPGMDKGIGVFVAENPATQPSDQWQPVAGGAALNVDPVKATRGQYAALVRDGKGRLIVAWQEQRAGYNGENATPERIHVRRLEDGKWVELAKELPAASPQSRAMSFAMAVHDGEPVVAVCDGTDGGRASLVVYTWKEGQWARLGGASLNVLGPDSGVLKPALVSDGKSIYVAWPEFLPSRPPLLFVKKWDGAKWSLVGGPLNDQPGKGSAHTPVMALLNGKPVVAWTEHNAEGETLRQIFVKSLK